MKKIIKQITIGVLISGLGVANGVQADMHSTNEVESYLKLRPRVEVVNSANDGSAVTNRLQFGIKSKNFLHVSGLEAELEALNVSAFSSDYDSSSAKGGSTTRATIVDPKTTKLSKALLTYSVNNTTLAAGHAPINLDNQRFIGSVDWRQTPQTFSQVSLKHTLTDLNLDLYGALLTDVSGIKPELDKTYKNGHIIAQGRLSPSKGLSVVGYTYLLESLHNTYGVRAVGNLENPNVQYALEYAAQKDSSIQASAVKIDTYYYNAEVGTVLNSMIMKLNLEVLGAKQGGTKGFATPFATGHKFNGWSDVLLGKASNGNDKGLRDISLTLGYTETAFGKFLIVGHQFNSVNLDTNYGTEIDLLYKRKLTDNANLILKAASFKQADDTTLKDTSKFWIMTEITL